MDTKTRKQEALELLALKELTYEQAERLNYLTATAAGMNTFYDPDNQFSEFTASREWVRTGYHDPNNNNIARELPEYSTSVDACLTLPRKEYGYFEISTSYSDNSVYPYVRYMVDRVEWQHVGDVKSLPLAILKCWWLVQFG